MKTLEEPAIVAPDRVIDADAPPKGDLATMELSGGEFETKLREAEEKAAAKEAPKDEPPPPKKDEPAKEPAKEKGKTPLDIAPAAKKDEPPAVEDELKTLIASEPPANASQSSKANHAAMRKGLERANSTITELRAENTELKSKPAAAPADVQERLTAAETAKAELAATLERVAFERSPKYQKFVQDGEAELASAKSYLDGLKNEDGEAIDPNIIDLAAHAKGPRRVAILTQAGLNHGTISAVTANLARADSIERDREAAQENWKSTQAEWTAEQTKIAEARAAQVKAAEDKVFESVAKKVSETLAPFQRVEGNDEWNVGVDARFKEAQEYWDGKKPLEVTAMMPYEALAGRIYKDAFEDLRNKYNDLVADNERTKAARPGAATTTQDGSGGLPDPKANPLDIAGDTFESNRARRGA